MTLPLQNYSHPSGAHGLALISALLALLVIAVIGVALGTGGAMFRKMVTAQDDQSISAAAAESVLVAVERGLFVAADTDFELLNPDSGKQGVIVSQLSGSTDPSAQSCAQTSWWMQDSCWGANNGVIKVGSNNALLASGQPLAIANLDLDSMELSAKPQFRIEVDMSNQGLMARNLEVGASGIRLYQITVRGNGRGDADSYLRSIFGLIDNTQRE